MQNNIQAVTFLASLLCLFSVSNACADSATECKVAKEEAVKVATEIGTVLAAIENKVGDAGSYAQNINQKALEILEVAKRNQREHDCAEIVAGLTPYVVAK